MTALASDVPNINKSLGKLRHGMPQLSNFDQFAADLKANDIELGTDNVRPDSLTPTQRNFNQDKVDALITSGKWNDKPIIVSLDNFVIDGHHRWLAAHQLHKPIKVRRVHMKAEDLLEFLKGKKYVLRKAINESAAV